MNLDYDRTVWLTLIEIGEIIELNAGKIAKILQDKGLTEKNENRFIPKQSTLDTGYAIWYLGDKTRIRWHFTKIFEVINGQPPQGAIIWMPVHTLAWHGMSLQRYICERLSGKYVVIQFSPDPEPFMKVYFELKTDAAIAKLHI